MNGVRNGQYDPVSDPSLLEFDDPYFDGRIPPRGELNEGDVPMATLGFANPGSYAGACAAISGLKMLLPGVIGSYSREIPNSGFEIIVWRHDVLGEEAQSHLENWLRSRRDDIQEVLQSAGALGS